MYVHRFPLTERHTMQDPNNFEKYDPPKQDRPVIGYRCTTHNFTTRSRMALQLHADSWTGRTCEIDVLRDSPNPLDAGWTSPPPAPKPEPAEPPHTGPHWEHDCELCIYLGSRSHCEWEYDLYVCPPNKFNDLPNLVARRGEMGDYVSGLSWVDREPMLAVAAILAMRQGHMSPSAIAN